MQGGRGQRACVNALLPKLNAPGWNLPALESVRTGEAADAPSMTGVSRRLRNHARNSPRIHRHRPRFLPSLRSESHPGNARSAPNNRRLTVVSMRSQRPGTERSSLFSFRNSRLFFIGQLISQIGSSMQVVALGWIALRLSHNGFVLGVVTAAPIFAMLVAGPFGGFVADRLPARPVLIGTSAALGVLSAVLGLLASHNALTVWQLVVSALLVGAVNAVGVPTTQVFVSEIAADSHLRQAITINNAILDLSVVVGAALVGPVIGWLGTAGVISANAVSYVAVIAALLFMRPGELHERQKAPKERAQLWRAVGYLAPRRDLLLLLAITAVVSVFATSLPPLLLLLSDQLGKGADTYGTLLTAISVGALTGACAMWRAKPALGTVLVGTLLLGVLESAAGAMPTVVTLIAVLFPIGVISVVLRTALLTLAQLWTDPELRGRVLALYLSVYRVGWLLGTLTSGWLARLWGPRAVLGLSGGAVAVTVLVLGIALVMARALSVTRTDTGFRLVLPRPTATLVGTATVRPAQDNP